MNSRIWRPALRLGVLAAVAGAADVEGQTLTACSSTLNYNYVYGAGADSHAGADLVPDASLLLSDVEGTGFSGSTSGVLTNGQPYSAGTPSRSRHAAASAGSAFPVATARRT